MRQFPHAVRRYDAAADVVREVVPFCTPLNYLPLDILKSLTRMASAEKGGRCGDIFERTFRRRVVTISAPPY